VPRTFLGPSRLSSGINEMKPINWRLIMFGLVVLFAAGPIGKYMRQQPNERERTTQPTNSAVSPSDIQVIVSSQDAEGATQQDLDLAFLKNFESYSIERIKQLTKNHLASTGSQAVDVALTAESNYIEVNGIKLALIRVRAADSTFNQIMVLGIVGNEIKRIGCIRNAAEAVPVSYGPCGEKIHAVFGVTLKTGDAR